MILFFSNLPKFYLKFTFILVFIFLGFCANAQRSCATVSVNDRTEHKINKTQRQQSTTQSKLLRSSTSSVQKTTPDGAVLVPVVVHVLYNNATQNISEAQILSQIEVLNKDFRKLNSDFNSTPAVFRNVGADIEIEFQLAEYDPDGNPTNGIVRKNVNFEIDSKQIKYFSSSLGGSDAWDTNQYLNIWVGPIKETTDGILLGFAYFSDKVGLAYDGVVINYIAFGTEGTAEFPFNKGRTTTHEIGHYFDLNHIWGPEKSSCSLADDDGSNDTPNQRRPSSGFPTFPDTDPETNCPDTGSNGTMFMNYMDYTLDAGMHLFTQDQKAIMQNALNGNRSGILNSVGFTCERDYYIDNDNDGFGLNTAVPFPSCTPVPGYARNNYDEDDNDFLDILIIGNPVKNGIFEINGLVGVVKKVTVFDETGRLLQTSTPNKIQPKIEIINPTRGTYFIVINAENTTFKRQIIVE